MAPLEISAQSVSVFQGSPGHKIRFGEIDQIYYPFWVYLFLIWDSIVLSHYKSTTTTIYLPDHSLFLVLYSINDRYLVPVLSTILSILGILPGFQSSTGMVNKKNSTAYDLEKVRETTSKIFRWSTIYGIYIYIYVHDLYIENLKTSIITTRGS